MRNMKALSYNIAVALFMLYCCGCTAAQNTDIRNVELREMAGQMIMVGFNGFEVSDTSHIIRDIADYHVGGIILFDYHVPESSPNRNIQNPDQVRRLAADLQDLSKVPLFIAIDQEGGRVARLKPARGFPEHRSAQYLGELDNPDSTRLYASRIAESLSDLGINVNFAPVVDLNVNPENPVIGRIERSFSPHTEIVVKHGSIFLEEFHKRNILGVMKHFPGHGSAWNDSHVGMADVTETWTAEELQPYYQLTDSDLHFGVMTAHVFNENLDAEWPATLSVEVQAGILRNRIGFEGILFSDDMQMEAIRSFYGLKESIARAILAGVDVLTFANNSIYDPDIVPKSVELILNLIEEGVLTKERIEESYYRIINTKKDMGLLEQE